jgi:hypothetical protein
MLLEADGFCGRSSSSSRTRSTEQVQQLSSCCKCCELCSACSSQHGLAAVTAAAAAVPGAACCVDSGFGLALNLLPYVGLTAAPASSSALHRQAGYNAAPAALSGLVPCGQQQQQAPEVKCSDGNRRWSASSRSSSSCCRLHAHAGCAAVTAVHLQLQHQRLRVRLAVPAAAGCMLCSSAVPSCCSAAGVTWQPQQQQQNDGLDTCGGNAGHSANAHTPTAAAVMQDQLQHHRSHQWR